MPELPKIGSIFKWKMSNNIFIVTKIVNDIIFSYDNELGNDEECTLNDFFEALDNNELECLFDNNNNLLTVNI